MNQFINLTNLKIGYTANIKQISDLALACKLTNIGVLPNSEVKIVRTTPFRHTFYIKSTYNTVALRKKEAEKILVSI